MPVDPTIVADLWAAFPAGYLALPGTATVCGAQALRGKDHSVVWFWPEDAKFSKPGLTMFDEARAKLDLLPDLDDQSTWYAALHHLAERALLSPGTRGVIWVPKSAEVVDRKRWSSGKALVGWTARTLTRSATFMIPGVTDERVALLKAIAMTNCACGRGPRAECPQHGDAKARPWR